MISRILSRLIVDPCIRAGRVPSSGLIANWFGNLADSRVVRVKNSHPLHSLLSRDDWKTTFSISDHSLMWLWRYLCANRPRAILEMGSGMSTLATGLYCQGCADGERPKVVSLDHDQGWLDQTRDRCSELKVDSFIDFQLAEIGNLNLPTEYGEIQGYLFDNGYIHEFLGSPDLVLIDGPPSSVGRMGTLPSVLPLLTSRCTILLDDAGRPKEQEAIRKWISCVGERLKHEATYCLGSGLGRLSYHPK